MPAEPIVTGQHRRRRTGPGRHRPRHRPDDRRDRAHRRPIPAHGAASVGSPGTERNHVRRRLRRGRHVRRRVRRDRRHPDRCRPRTWRDPVRGARLATRARTHRALPPRTLHRYRNGRRRRPHHPSGDVVPRRRLRPARHRSGRGGRAARRRPRVRHRRRRGARPAARGPHPRQLGALGDQAGRRRSDG